MSRIGKRENSGVKRKREFFDWCNRVMVEEEGAVVLLSKRKTPFLDFPLPTAGMD